jgi:hypothetical protein
MDDLLSQSPNPRPKLAVPLSRQLTEDQCNHLAGQYNAMVDEIEKLSAHIVKLGGKPSDALAA